MSMLLGLFAIGFLYGATTCSFACLPYLAPSLIVSGNGFVQGVRSSGVFLSGKLLGYMGMSGVAAALGAELSKQEIAGYNWVLGAVLIGAGIALPFLHSARSCDANRRGGQHASLFIMGASTSVTPCPALISLFALAAHSGSIAQGMAYGFAYGVGLAVSPALLTGGLLAMLGQNLQSKAQRWLPSLKILASGVLVLMGVQILSAGF